MELAGILLLAFILGLRHGLDWDHVAALADITGDVTGSKRKRIQLSFWYAIGHELIVCLLGTSIILFAWNVPLWVDSLMGKVIGITLIVMAVWMLIARTKAKRTYMSRGTAFLQKLRGKKGMPFTFTKSNVFAIGIIHGIGAETPSQLLLFTTLAGLAAHMHGIAVVAVFSSGLFVTHLLIAAAGVLLHDTALKTRRYYPVTAYAAAALSFLLGFQYIL